MTPLFDTSIAGTADATAEQAALVADVTYLYAASVATVIRYTTSGGTDASATPATGDHYVPAGAERVLRLRGGWTHVSIVKATGASDGAYTISRLTI